MKVVIQKGNTYSTPIKNYARVLSFDVFEGEFTEDVRLARTFFSTRLTHCLVLAHQSLRLELVGRVFMESWWILVSKVDFHGKVLDKFYATIREDDFRRMIEET